MESNVFLRRAFYLKGSIILMLFISLQSCVEDNITNISDNVMLEQSFAIPIGSREVRLSKPPISDTSSKGPNIYTYDNLPYSTNSKFLSRSESVNLNLSSNPNSNWIKKITFNIKTENSFLVNTFLQVYLIDTNDKILDKFFSGDGFSNYGYSPNTDTIVYEGGRLELLKQAKLLQYELKIRSDGAFLSLTDENKLKVSIGAKAELEYNAKELNN